MMQVSKKIPFDDPQVLLGVRILYIVTNIIIAGVYLYLQTKINAKKGKHPSGAHSGLSDVAGTGRFDDLEIC